MRLVPTLFAVLAVTPALAKAPKAGVPPVLPTEPPPAPAPASPPAPPDDPYLWLEEVEGEKSLSWVREQNEESLGELQGDGGYKALESRIRAVLDSDARIPYPEKIGKHWYNFWKDREHPRGLWRRTTWAEYGKAEPHWEVVLDVDALGAAEKESWVWHGADCLPPQYTRCLVTLSRGGADAAVIREFDLERLAWVEGGFTIPESKSFANWVDRDTLYVGADWGPESWTSSGYPREVRRWKRGTPIEAAEPVFAGEKSDVSVVAWRDFTPGSEREWVERGTTFYSSKLYLVQAGNLVVVPKPDDAIATSFRDWLLLELRSDLMEGARTYLRGSLLAIRLDAFLSGDRAFDVLFEPTARTSLAEVRSTRNRLIIRTLDNVRGKVEILAPGKGGWTRKAMAGLPTLGNVSVWGADPYQNDEVLFTVTDYVTPTTLSWQDLGKGRSKAMKSLPAFFEARGLAVTQHEATSQDGTRVPYFQVARSDAPKGPQPTLLYGYGGFEVSMLPNYSGVVGASWLEKGGVYVVANIRGGGEFGPSWHQAALKANRPRAYEDFAAVARDLVARGITDKDHLGTMGGSNGGLLMGNMTVSYPELFEAVVCSVPLLDMKRYHLLLAGASWMGEYGDPEQPGEWDFIQHFSPYQLVRRDGEYPRVLFMTSTRDDRVHPGHARKMAARMQEYGKNILYFENIEGGHGGAADNGQAARQWALAYTFLWRELQ